VIPRLVVTSGEPAGIGPDILLAAAAKPQSAQLVGLGDKALLATRAQQLGLDVRLVPYSSTGPSVPHQPGELPLIDVPLSVTSHPGALDPRNASQVLAQLDLAIELCRNQECQGMVTAPVHKSVINEAEIPFSGHTEYLASALHVSDVVMLLVSGDLRIALATTHLPLRDVPDAINQPLIERKLAVIAQTLSQQFGIDRPRLTVLGLNPHAGESGHLGKEELDVIEPSCKAARAQGLTVIGPISADTAFTPEQRQKTDAYLAMFHDQGLPVLKTVGFGDAVNVTLGLPIIRTSVDHGTAIELAGTGQAKASSLQAAITLAEQLALKQRGTGQLATSGS
jgi:4-hydroxythreonine-4-phosphate dehydrogenase